MTGPLRLRAGALEVELWPAIGGSIGRFDRIDEDGRQPLLRGAEGALDDVLAAACFPLVPYANRIRGGRFTCDGREVRLEPNMAGDASPLHGTGWLAAWDVASSDEREAVLVYRHPAGEWPWAFEARQTIALDPDGFSVTLACRNLSPEPMPCGLGLHPYYPCDAATILDTTVASAWTVDAAVLPVDKVPATGRYDLRNRRISGQGLDNGYDGWGGDARFIWPGRRAGLRLTSPDAHCFQVYAPPSGGFFAAEPVQNANAALNEPQGRWPELGITMVEQGREASLHARFDVMLQSNAAT